jgi:hypothetical protein
MHVVGGRKHQPRRVYFLGNTCQGGNYKDGRPGTEEGTLSQCIFHRISVEFIASNQNKGYIQKHFASSFKRSITILLFFIFWNATDNWGRKKGESYNLCGWWKKTPTTAYYF